MILPTDGNIGVKEVLAAIQQGSALLGAAAVLDVRSIAVQVGGRGWLNHATIARVTDELAQAPANVIRMGQVAVTHTRCPLEDLSDEDALRRVLTHWRRAVEASTGFAFSDSWIVRRRPTGNELADSPCWLVTGYEQINDRGHYGASGPFFNVETGLFGEDLGGLATEWLGAPWLKQQTVVQYSYDIVIPDRRARFTGYQAEGDRLIFLVDASIPEDSLRCAIVSQHHSGRELRQARPVRDGRVMFDFPGSVKRLDVWLFDAEGEWLDQYHESEYGASWGPSIYNAPRELNDSAYAAVKAALESGENEWVEFKAWVDPTSGSSKASELPRTVVAFANSGGGEIFVGISDDAEIRDITLNLKKLYAKSFGGDNQRLIEAYIAHLKKVIREDITPVPDLAFEPVTVAEQQLIRIRVSEMATGPCSLVRNGVILVRRGATNKPIPASELAERLRSAPRGLF